MRILSEHRATGAKILSNFPRVELLDKGVLTQDEFEREKRKILDGSENF